ncbi:hypothetical protein [Lentzea flaviverrucosa]|nr:hypothetical protein [Lentzea flaviverrucosa]
MQNLLGSVDRSTKVLMEFGDAVDSLGEPSVRGFDIRLQAAPAGRLQ